MVAIIDEAKFKIIIPAIDELMKLLNGLINYMQRAELK